MQHIKTSLWPMQPVHLSSNKYICWTCCLSKYRRTIGSITDPRNYWICKGVNFKQSNVADLQGFCPKSETSLNAGAVAFYPYHIAMLNSLKTRGRKDIVAGRTITKYLPIRFDAGGGELKSCAHLVLQQRHSWLAHITCLFTFIQGRPSLEVDTDFNCAQWSIKNITSR